MVLIDPNPGGLVFSDNIYILDIPGVDQDIDLLQDLTLSESLVAYNLLIKVGVDEGT